MREAISILRQIEKLPDIVRFTDGEVAGSVSLGMSSTLASFLAGAFMKACQTALPTVNLSLATGDSATLSARVLAETLDLAILFGNETRSTPGLVRTPLFRQRLYLLEQRRASKAPKTVSIAQLSKTPLILPSLPNPTRSLIDSFFAEAGSAPIIAAEANTLPDILSAVQSGMGAAIAPIGDLSATQASGRFSATPIEPAIHQTVYVVFSDGAALTRAGEGVRELLGSFIHAFVKEHSPPGMESVRS